MALVPACPRLTVWFLVGLVTALTLSSVVSADEPLGTELGSDALTTTHPILGSQLGSLLGALDVRGFAAASDAAQVDLASGNAAETAGPNSKVLVSVHFTGAADRIVQFLDGRGVTALNLGPGYFEAYVPLGVLGDLARLPGVNRIREVSVAEAVSQSSSSATARAHLADKWHALGRMGRGVKVGVIDTRSGATSRDGFKGLRALMGTGLPSRVLGHCFDDVGNPTDHLTNCDPDTGGDDHGTNVAESVLAVAPEATLYISNPKSWGDLRRATEWMVQHGVKVIVHSVGWFPTGPGDGTSPISSSPVNTTNWAIGQGVLWVNAAGNDHGKSWYGPFNDADNDNILEWAPGLERLSQDIYPGSYFTATLRWDDKWGGTTSNLDLVMYHNGKEVASSRDLQSGAEGDYAVETIRYGAESGGKYYFEVRSADGSKPSWVQLQLRGTDRDFPLQHASAGYSIASPAENPNLGMLAVGATRYTDLVKIQGYSSRGPTTYGVIKPDIVGVDCGRLSRTSSFCGTSQAAPHVAGLAALVLAENPSFTPQKLAQYLKDHADDRGAPGNDNIWGHGIAQAPKVDCAAEEVVADGEHTGVWTDICSSMVPGRGYAWHYQFYLDQSATIKLDLKSQLDTHLYLRQGENRRSGTALHENDNAQDDTPTARVSRITATLPAGAYTVEATTVGAPQTGDYSFAISGLPTSNGTRPGVSISAGADITEGGDAVFSLTLTQAPISPRNVNVRVSQLGDAAAESEIRDRALQISGSAHTITIPTSDDSVNEIPGEISITIIDGNGYTFDPNARRASIKVADNDPAPPLAEVEKAVELQLKRAIDNYDRWSWGFWNIALKALRSKFPPPALRAMTPDLALQLAGIAQAQHNHGSASLWASVADTLKVVRTPLRLTLSAADEITEGDDAVFTIKSRPAPKAPHDVTVKITQQGGFASGGRHQVTIDTNGHGSLKIPTTDDSVDEQDGSVTATVTDDADNTATATVRVLDDDTDAGAPVLTLTKVQDVTEGYSAPFKIEANPRPSTEFFVTVQISQTGKFVPKGSLGEQTVLIKDYGLGVINVPTTDDNRDEFDGFVIATLKEAPGYSVGQGTATVKVKDNDSPTPLEGRILAQIATATQDNNTFTRDLWRRALAGVRHELPPDNLEILIVPVAQHHANSHRKAGQTVLADLWQDVADKIKSLLPKVKINADRRFVTEGEDCVFTIRSVTTKPVAPIHIGLTVTAVGDHAEPANPDVWLGVDGIGKVRIPSIDDRVYSTDTNLVATIQPWPTYNRFGTHDWGEDIAACGFKDNDPQKKDPTPPELSVTAGGDITEGDDAVFTVTANPAGRSHKVTVAIARQGSFGVPGQNLTVAVPAGGTAIVTLPTDNDDVDEVDGSITATLVDGAGYTVSGTQGAATVNVADDDQYVATIEPGNDINEGERALFTVKISPPPASPITVSVNVKESTDQPPFGEYRNITVGTSGKGVVTDFWTDNDSKNGPDRFAIATISADLGGYTIGTPGEARVRIKDDDIPALSITAAKSVTEGGTITFRIRANPRPYRSLSVGVALTTQGGFITERTETVTVGVTGTGTYRVTVLDDDAHLPNGSVTATLQDGSGYKLANKKSITVAVTDNDDPAKQTPEVTIAAGPGVTEGGDATFTVTANPVPTASLDVTVDVAQLGDFGVATGSRTVTIPTTGSATLTVATVDDSVDEVDGSVTATLVAGSGYTVGSSNTASVAIADDDDPPPLTPEVSIVAGAGVSEGSAAVFTVSASPPPVVPLDVTVDVSQSGDFTSDLGSRTVTISTAGSVTLTVVTVDDSVDEVDGSVTATVIVGSGYTVSSTQGSASVVVADDDVPVVVFVADAALVADVRVYAAETHKGTEHVERWKRVLVGLCAEDFAGLLAMTSSEAQSFADLGWSRWVPVVAELVRAEAAGGCASVPPPPIPEVAITAGAGVTEGAGAVFTITATPPPAGPLDVTVDVSQSGDYVTTGTRTVTIPSTGTVTLTIATTNDSTDEADGSVTATLATGSGYTVSVSQGSASVAVSDDDDAVPVVDTSVLEAEIQRRIDLTAQKGDDHSNRIWRGALVAVRGEQPTGDARDVDAAFAQRLAGNHRSGGRTELADLWQDIADTLNGTPPPPPPQSVVSITGGAGVTEGGGAVFTITAIPPPSGSLDVTVDVSQSGDFTSGVGSRTVTVPATGSATLSVVTVDDSTDEADGSITVTVQSGNGYTVSGLQGSATVAVSDDDDPLPPPPQTPEITITGGAGVTEGGGVVFTITANPPPAQSLTVGVVVSQSGDFISGTVPTSVTIPSTGTVTLTVATVDDSTDEADGSVTATVQTGNGYTVGSPSRASVAVSDDDPAPVVPVVSITAGPGVTEGGDMVFTLTANPPPAVSLTVMVNVTQSGDFISGTVPTSVTIPSTGTVTLTVATVNDSTDEADGSVTATVQTGNGYTVSGSAGSATVVVSDDDDPPPAGSLDCSNSDVKIDEITIEEPSGMFVFATFKIEICGNNWGNTHIDYHLEHITTDNADFHYFSIGGTLVFDPFETTDKVSVMIGRDNIKEGPETFALVLTDVYSYRTIDLGTGRVLATITDPN